MDIEYLNKIRKQNKILIVILLILIVVNVVIFIVSNDNCSEESNNKMVSLYYRHESFNSQFTVYSGEQTGFKLKSLMGTLIANANTYYSEPQRIPEVIIKNNGTITYYVERPNNCENIDEKYQSNLSNVRNALFNKMTYKVEFTYFEDLALDKIIITGELSKDIGN